MAHFGRRAFLGSIGVAAISRPTLANSTNNRTVIRGKIEKFDGEPARHGHIDISADSPTSTSTNKGGVFRKRLDSDEYFPIFGYYQRLEGGRKPTPLRDGSPDLYTLPEARTEGNSGNVGTFELPEAHLLQIKVTDEAGDPVDDALVRITHWGPSGGGWGTGWHPTNHEGYHQFADAEHPGAELVGDIRVQADRERNRLDPAAEQELELTSDQTLELQI